MRQATEPNLRNALADYMDAVREYDALQISLNEAKAAFFAAGDRKLAREAAAAKLVAAERGVVTYDGLAFEAIGSKLTLKPLAREIRIEQEPLPLGVAHG